MIFDGLASSNLIDIDSLADCAGWMKVSTLFNLLRLVGVEEFVDVDLCISCWLTSSPRHAIGCVCLFEVALVKFVFLMGKKPTVGKLRGISLNLSAGMNQSDCDCLLLVLSLAGKS